MGKRRSSRSHSNQSQSPNPVVIVVKCLQISLETLSKAFRDFDNPSVVFETISALESEKESKELFPQLISKISSCDSWDEVLCKFASNPFIISHIMSYAFNKKFTSTLPNFLFNFQFDTQLGDTFESSFSHIFLPCYYHIHALSQTYGFNFSQTMFRSTIPELSGTWAEPSLTKLSNTPYKYILNQLQLNCGIRLQKSEKSLYTFVLLAHNPSLTPIKFESRFLDSSFLSSSSSLHSCIEAVDDLEDEFSEYDEEESEIAGRTDTSLGGFIIEDSEEGESLGEEYERIEEEEEDLEFEEEEEEEDEEEEDEEALDWRNDDDNEWVGRSRKKEKTANKIEKVKQKKSKEEKKEEEEVEKRKEKRKTKKLPETQEEFTTSKKSTSKKEKKPKRRKDKRIKKRQEENGKEIHDVPEEEIRREEEELEA
ncbi:hypothetical protein ADUPG1_009530, partial [Aduncisulcus paluster]